MELIHVWIRGLHPFEECSFGLTGRFDTSIEVNDKRIEINIEENKDFPINFFGKNIDNVSAIIGKNGAGKSRLFNNIINTLGREREEYYSEDYVFLYLSHKEKTFYVKHGIKSRSNNKTSHQDSGIMQNDNTSLNFKLKNEFEYDVSELINPIGTEIVFYSSLFNLSNRFTLMNKEKCIDVSTDFLVYSDSESVYNKRRNIIDTHRFKNTERQILFIDKFKEEKQIKDKFTLPEYITIHRVEIEGVRDVESNLSISVREIRNHFLDKYGTSNIGAISKAINQVGNKIYELEREKKGTKNIADYNLRRVGLIFLRELVTHYFITLNLNGEFHERKSIIDIEEIKYLNPWEGFLYYVKKQDAIIEENKDNLLNFISALRQLFDIRYTNAVDVKDSVSTDDFSRVLTLLKLHSKYITSFPVKDSDRITDLIQVDWRTISSGEKAFLDIFSRLYYSYSEIKKKNSKLENHCKYLYLFIDEGEVGFHPEWQREYVNLITKVVPIIFKDMNVQIILTSHSPFIISDIPYENVVFLKREGNGTSEVAKKEETRRTFAANIHSLLADDFFMKNGLIGEFAKGKIQEVINWLNIDNNTESETNSNIDTKNPEDKNKASTKKSKTKSTIDTNESEEEKIKRMKYTISMIGEPIVRGKLLEMYHRKINPNESEIDKLERERRELDKKIKELTDKSQND